MSLVTDFLKLFKWDTTNEEDLESDFDIDKSLNENWEKIDNSMKTLNENKVEKVKGKDLSTNDFSKDCKEKLDNIEEKAQVNVLEKLTMDGKTINIDKKSAEIKDSEVKDARKSTTKNKTFTSVTERIEELEKDLNTIDKSSGHIYGVRRKITNNTSSSWERIEDSKNLVANATKNGGVVQNDFDTIAPWSEIKSCNYDLETGKVKAWFGDANFNFNGENGDVYTYIPDVYLKIYQENDYDYVLISDVERSGFVKYNSFFISRYAMSVVGDKLRSYTDLAPAHNKTISQFRTLAKALGDKFCLLDYRYFVLQMLYLVEYANYNSQSMLGNGVMTQQQAKALIAEQNTNRIVVSSTNLYAGRTIGIGSAWANFSIATDRKVVRIEEYSNNGVVGKSIVFDGDPVNIAVDNVVWGCGQHSGQCDDLGMKSGCKVNDGFHSVIYRGIENLFSNMWQFVDGITIQDRIAYMCKDPTAYADSKITAPYKKLGYTNGNTNGYTKVLGFDPDEPLCRFPVEIGASTSTGTADYYYQDAGTRLARVGGDFGAGAGDGLWCWYLYNAFSYSSVSVGCRVLINNQ